MPIGDGGVNASIPLGVQSVQLPDLNSLITTRMNVMNGMAQYADRQRLLTERANTNAIVNSPGFDITNPDSVNTLMRGAPQTGLATAKDLQLAETQRLAIQEGQQKLMMTRAMNSVKYLMQDNTPEQFTADAQAQLKRGDITPMHFQALTEQMPTDPAGFDAWKKKTAYNILLAVSPETALKQNTTMVNQGNQMGVVTSPEMMGSGVAPTLVGSLGVGQSPDNKATVAATERGQNLSRQTTLDTEQAKLNAPQPQSDGSVFLPTSGQRLPAQLTSQYTPPSVTGATPTAPTAPPPAPYTPSSAVPPTAAPVISAIKNAGSTAPEPELLAHYNNAKKLPAGVYPGPPPGVNMNTGVDKMSPVEFQQRQNAVRSLPLIRYNYATGEDAMPDLIKASVNGTFSEELKNVVQFMGFPSSKAGAQETLHAIASGLTVAHIPGNGGISSGFSDERQKMLEQQMAAIDNPHIPVETRLRAWTDGAKPRLMEQAGPAYAGAYKPPVPGAPINTTPTKSSKSINFNDLK